MYLITRVYISNSSEHASITTVFQYISYKLVISSHLSSFLRQSTASAVYDLISSLSSHLTMIYFLFREIEVSAISETTLHNLIQGLNILILHRL